jgi:hypothetical protein
MPYLPQFPHQISVCTSPPHIHSALQHSVSSTDHEAPHSAVSCSPMLCHSSHTQIPPLSTPLPNTVSMIHHVTHRVLKQEYLYFCIYQPSYIAGYQTTRKTLVQKLR